MAKKQQDPPPARMVPPDDGGYEGPFEKGRRISKEMGIDFETGRRIDKAGNVFPDPQQVLAREKETSEAALKDQRLPWDGHEFLTKHGFVFGKRLGLYVEVTTWPAGYTTGHEADPRGIWIKDPNGKKIASGFIKDVSYDPYASISPCHAAEA